jgi:DNA polymerase-3 subunit delta'
MSDDDIPEADRAEGAPHPRHTVQVFGQEAAEQTVLSALNEGRRHHAWLLTGPKGVGKASFAWRLARYLRTEPDDGPGLFGEPSAATTLDTDPEHPVARRIAALSDPGTLLIRRAWDQDRKKLKAQITVEEVRRLNSFFGLSATDGGTRVVIVDSADEMNPSAANALLKVLEEPPAKAVLLLVSHQPARLLPTIRSRCRVLRFQKLSPETLSRALQQAGVDAPDGPALAELADGSAGDALRLITGDGLNIYKDLVTLLSQAPQMDRQAARRFADAASARGAETRMELSLRLIDLALVRLARSATGQTPAAEAAPGERDALTKLSKVPARKWAELQQTLSARLGHGMAVNVDPSSLLMDALLQINETARG